MDAGGFVFGNNFVDGFRGSGVRHGYWCKWRGGVGMAVAKWQ
jgi:hypothetical protein